jgi:hypothetical protein
MEAILILILLAIGGMCVYLGMSFKSMMDSLDSKPDDEINRFE